ncbi:hypothetical protein CC85DRAFT_282265 [Cutaneotrichosporon oleaginosum]|uniref:Mediator complex subunit 9 n=1 Tax=Cutaneotrichosporon oleaginosum TaxID=879819 RepID=A0A0J1BC94_9TREE|nr:uncharacterized protein CC85DRAFT_282265 [Cutaneotrichosporon oleaginosum]KLT45644.1 hypothetical protein CC85DRAFT_282265 [Cutaneotrichosporon oleaginosum]TXT04563.1 hypothetical protein COLE_07382 [Cutaneotrichosporon oleaginosum]
MDRAPLPPALAPCTFSSILPSVEEILGLVYRLSEGEGANDEIVQKVKVIAAQIASMKAAASNLPGGHLGTDAVRELTRILEEQAESKRAVLRQFAEASSVIAEKDGASP